MSKKKVRIYSSSTNQPVEKLKGKSRRENDERKRREKESYIPRWN